MKKINLTCLVLLLATLMACDSEDVTPNNLKVLPDTVNPTVKIDSPVTNTSFLVIERVMLNIKAYDNRRIGTLQVFMSGPDARNVSVLMAEATSVILNNESFYISILLPRDISAGNYTIIAKAIDFERNEAKDSITIAVQAPDLGRARFIEAFEKVNFFNIVGFWDYDDFVNGVDFDELWFGRGFFAMVDTNLDAGISKTEWDLFNSDFAVKDQVWAKWDVNNDGIQSEDEFRKGLSDLKLYTEWDTNKDALISANEVASGIFGRWDQNKDDLLSKEEYQEKFYRYLLR